MGYSFFAHIFPNSLKIWEFLFTAWYIFGYIVTCSIVADFRSPNSLLFTQIFYTLILFLFFSTSVCQKLFRFVCIGKFMYSQSVKTSHAPPSTNGKVCHMHKTQVFYNNFAKLPKHLLYRTNQGHYFRWIDKKSKRSTKVALQTNTLKKFFLNLKSSISRFMI